MLLFDTFCDRLTRELSKLSQLDVTPKSHALIAQSKGKGRRRINLRQNQMNLPPLLKRKSLRRRSLNVAIVISLGMMNGNVLGNN